MTIKLGKTCRFDIKKYFNLSRINLIYTQLTGPFQCFNTGVKSKQNYEAFSK